MQPSRDKLPDAFLTALVHEKEHLIAPQWLRHGVFLKAATLALAEKQQ